MNDKNHKYKMLYKLTPTGEGITREEIAALADPNVGACDQVILHSIIKPQDGGLSTLIFSADGATGQSLSAEEEFKSWALMAHHLMGRLPRGWRRAIVGLVVSTRAADAGEEEG